MTSKTITLDSPIQRGDQKITTITLNKPQGSGWTRGVSLIELLQMNSTALATVLPRITEPALTQSDVLSKLDPADLFQLATEVTGFLLPRSAVMDESQPESKTSGPTLQ